MQIHTQYMSIFNMIRIIHLYEYVLFIYMLGERMGSSIEGYID